MLVDGHAQRNGTEPMVHFWYRVAAGAVITLRWTSLGGQQCNAIWRLRAAPDMQHSRRRPGGRRAPPPVN
ncbi:hypothetical protein [Burkholderia sp. BE17]|uniref:hypothetical protein n=1 Tax=Burkholderia sp. BE17 TaxID=2656644 RepID=UPI001D117F5F|nr:hypothetical protein [Burkholderia sp. BE17]